jgi:hypothetical protein
MRTVKVRILPPQPIFSFSNLSTGDAACLYKPHLSLTPLRHRNNLSLVWSVP